MKTCARTNLPAVSVLSVVLLGWAVAAPSLQAAVLIARYEFENVADLGLDSAGNSDPGVVGTGVSQTVGVLPGTSAASFSGTGCITINNTPLNGDYTGVPGFSFAAWVKLPEALADYGGVVSQDAGSLETRLLITPGETPRPFFNAHDWPADHQIAYTLPVGPWFHIAMTAENQGAGAVARIFVNGIDVSGSVGVNIAVLPSSAGFKTYVGSGAYGTTYRLKGVLDDVRIYEGAMTAAEVANLLPQWALDGSGTWSTASNWSGNIPSGTDAMANFYGAITSPQTVTVDGARTVGTINFNNSNKYTIAGSALTMDVSAGSASMVVGSGSHEISAPLVLGDNTAVNVVPAASTLTLSGAITGGGGLTKNGAGTLTTSASAGWLFVGTTTSDLGSATMNAGTWNIQNQYVVLGSNGGSGTAQFTQTGGTVNYSGGGGVYLANGSGVSQMTISGGAFNQTGGNFHIGVRNNAALTVSGTAVVTIPSNMIIGWGPEGQTLTGALNLNAGTVNQTGGYFALSNNYNGTGHYIQTGGAYNFTGTGNSYIGNYGTGQMTVSAGTFTQPNGTMYVGYRGPGTLQLSGTGSVTVPAISFGALGGSGTVNLNGGTLTTGSLARGTGTGTVNFNGGVLRASATTATFMQGLTAANVLSGGAKIDTQGNTVTIGQSLLDGGGGGGLTKLGSGTLILTGTNTYSGGTVISQGTLRLGNLPSNGLAAWYDAGVGVTTGGGVVTTWADRTGQHDATRNASSTVGPTLAASQVNGLPAVLITGTGSQGGWLNVAGSFKAGSVYTVFRSPTTSFNTYGTVFGSTSEAAGSGRTFIFESGAAQMHYNPYPAGVRKDGNAVTATPYVISPVNQYMVLGVDVANSGNTRSYYIGRTDSWMCSLDIAEILVYDRVLTTAEENQLGAYLAQKYGITTAYTAQTQNAIPDGSIVSIASGAVLDLFGGSETIGALADYPSVGNAGTVTNSLLGPAGVLTLAATSGSSTFSGVIQDGLGPVNLVKTGGATQILAGANTYTGTTTVSGGTLLVNGTHDGGGLYTVAAGGTLGGTGTIGTSGADVVVATGGYLAPGTSAGTLTFSLGSGTLDLSSVGTGGLVFELGAVDASDKVVLTTGSLNIGTLDFAEFDFQTISGFGLGTYTLFDASSTIAGSLGTAWGKVGGNPAYLWIDSANYDVLLSVVPEPSTLGLLSLGGVGLGLCLRRRSRRQA
jgi:autotransporter-associated beta strand protein